MTTEETVEIGEEMLSKPLRKSFSYVSMGKPWGKPWGKEKGETEEPTVHSIREITLMQPRVLKIGLYVVLSVGTFGLLNLFNIFYRNIQPYFTLSRSVDSNSGRFVKVKSSYDKSNTYCRVVRKIVQGEEIAKFTFRNVNFLLKGNDGYEKLRFVVNSKPTEKEVMKFRKDYELRKFMFGENQVKIPLETNLLKLFILEVIHPFFLFQIFSMLIWAVDDYYYYAGIIFFISTVSILITIFGLRSNRMKLKKRFNSKTVAVSRLSLSGENETLQSSKIVPGDVITLTENSTDIPCDLVLLHSECYTNEGILTGESKPILKTSNFKELSKNHILFAGTTLVKQNAQIRGLVLRTAFDTKKGELICSILFEKQEISFEFLKDALKFMVAMFIGATFLFVFSMIRMIVIGTRVYDIIMRALDLFTIIVPPTLPIAIEEGMNSSIRALKRKKITCLFPQRINSAGKVSIFCFDKTGTLTEDELHLKKTVVANASDEKRVLDVLGCCHSLTEIDGKVDGDPLEIALYESSQYKLVGKGDLQNEEVIYTVLDREKKEIRMKKIFQFESCLQRMSVVTDENVVYVKGSPEKIFELSKRDSLNADRFQKRLKKYTKKGYRVLCCAWKKLKVEKNVEIKREAVETGLLFLGFIIISNHLKKETIATVEVLENADVAPVIVTGDNLLTGVKVGLESKILKDRDTVVIVNYDQKSDCLKWIDYENDTSLNYDDSKFSRNVVMDGKTFTYLKQKYLDDNFLPRKVVSGDVVDFCKVINNAVVFARMSPFEKLNLVKTLKKINKNILVGFCGDGTNDCAAIKFSDCGISVSPSNESSLISHFCSFDISCVPQVLKESKASLQTSFSIFKFIILYSVLQGVSVVILNMINTNLSDVQFLIADLLIIFPVCIVMGKTDAKKELIEEKPSTSLITLEVIFSILFQSCSYALVICFVWIDLHEESWFTPVVPEPKTIDNIQCYEATVVFFVSCLITINNGVIFSIEKPFKRSILQTNLFFVAVIGAMYVFVLTLMFCKIDWFNDWALLEPIDDVVYILKLIFVCFFHLFIGYIVEYYFCRELRINNEEGEKCTLGDIWRRIVKFCKKEKVDRNGIDSTEYDNV